jgi:hypothetical protein
MDETDGGCPRIDKINRAAVSDMNAERDTALACNQSVAAGELFVVVDWKIDNCDLVAMDLLDRHKWPISKTDLAADFPVRVFQPAQSFGFVMRNVDPGDALNESSPTNAWSIKRRKMFDRLLRCHLQTCRACTTSALPGYFELGSLDIGVTGIGRRTVPRLGFPVASTSLPV